MTHFPYENRYRGSVMGFALSLVFSLSANAQTATLLTLYEFDKPTLQENGWIEIPGGLTGAPKGSVELFNFNANEIPSSQDKKGISFTVKPGKVVFIHAKEPINTEDAPVLLRLIVRANKPSAAVALLALKGNMVSGKELDGSIATHIPASASSFIDKERCLVLLYQPDSGNEITPAIQIAATGRTDEVSVLVDKLEVYR